MFSRKTKLMIRTLLKPNSGCGCKQPKPSDVYQPIPKPKISVYQNNNPSSLDSSTTSRDGDDDGFFTATTSEPDTLHDHHNVQKPAEPSPKLANSVAVEKESEDPYRDFRDSMLQMIVEREIFSESDLRELLECFLQLNATCHHRVIVQAFVAICEEAFPKKKK